MRWEKRGVIWKPNGNLGWARSHASCPTPWLINERTLRLYIQCRDESGVGRVGYVDIDPSDPTKVLKVAQQPVLDIGAPGSFDDNGVFQTAIVDAGNGKLFMYYVGFELCHHIRYRLLTGLAISDDGGESFRKYKTTPILERSAAEMFFRCGPFVQRSHEGKFKMWYVGGSSWETIDGKAMPIYDLRYMESKDGMHWPEQGEVIFRVDPQTEHGFGRPYIIKRGETYQMFYSIRRKSPCAYRMGYAESSDGLHWQRKDHLLGLDVSDHGWDSESVEYAAVIEVNNRVFCFYNGNDFGGTGIGLAELID